MIETIMSILEIALVVVGGASTIVLGLEKIAGVTPSDKDDYYVGELKRILGGISHFLDKLALNPKK